jgi:hypothetical protein
MPEMLHDTKPKIKKMLSTSSLFDKKSTKMSSRDLKAQGVTVEVRLYDDQVAPVILNAVPPKTKFADLFPTIAEEVHLFYNLNM